MCKAPKVSEQGVTKQEINFGIILAKKQKEMLNIKW